MREMKAQGMTDAEMADILCVTKGAIYLRRKTYKIPATKPWKRVSHELRQNVEEMLRGGYGPAMIARECGCSTDTVSMIKRGLKDA